MDSAIWGLIGTLVGALSSIGTTWLASRSSHHLQTVTRSHELAERASSFQRQTLLDLQEALHDALRLTTQAHIQDRDSHLGGTTWGSNMLNEPLNEDLRLAQRRVAILNERISDENLRTKVRELMGIAHNALLAKSPIEARANLQQCYTAGAATLETVGTVLRSHY